MAPKKGNKRKAAGADIANGNADDTPPDRATWPGWVEMESEPAFFNVMLSDMGVEGVKVQEVYGLDDEMLAILPQPVHALIFLFRYRAIDEDGSEKATECPQHVWFANQIPDFACATVALLNIVNNIKGLKMGKELRDFKSFTRDMDPISRGDAIDGFDFVRQIHNSFARENELLQADLHYKRKIDRAKKKNATAKARETREARRDNKPPTNGGTPKELLAPQRSSARTREAPKEVVEIDSNVSSPLSDPPDSDPEFDTPSKSKQPSETNGTRRRSARRPKPRQSAFASSAAVQEEEDEDGFHFIAYMPIQGHVWHMDGLDKIPQDMGEYEAATGGDWMNIAGPALETRMALYEGADIEFNLMAVVHDAIVMDRVELAQNIKALQAIEKKLDKTVEDWRELDGVETKSDVLTGMSTAFKISEADIENAVVPQTTVDEMEKQGDIVQLVEIRKDIIRDQAPLRGAVRDATEAAQADQEKAQHRRHDYGAFVRAWLGVLADNGSLAKLLEGAE